MRLIPSTWCSLLSPLALPLPHPLHPQLHSLPRLSYTFAFSSASHPLLAVFRGLAPIHAQLLSLKTRDVLSHQLGLALKEVQVRRGKGSKGRGWGWG